MRKWDENSVSSDDVYRVNHREKRGNLSEEHLKTLARLGSGTAWEAAPKVETREERRERRERKKEKKRQTAQSLALFDDSTHTPIDRLSRSFTMEASSHTPETPPEHPIALSRSAPLLQPSLVFHTTPNRMEQPPQAQTTPRDNYAKPPSAPGTPGTSSLRASVRSNSASRVKGAGSVHSMHSIGHASTASTSMSPMLSKVASATNLIKVAEQCSDDGNDLTTPQLVALLKRSAAIMKAMKGKIRDLTEENERLQQPQGCDETRTAIDRALKENGEMGKRVVALQKANNEIPRLKKEVTDMRKERGLALDEIEQLQMKVAGLEENSAYHPPTLLQRSRRTFASVPESDPLEDQIDRFIQNSPHATSLSKVAPQIYHSRKI